MTSGQGQRGQCIPVKNSHSLFWARVLSFARYSPEVAGADTIWNEQRLGIPTATLTVGFKTATEPRKEVRCKVCLWFETVVRSVHQIH